jgi:di/tricarboxylate transporter
MTPEIAICLGILAIAVVLFATEIIPADVTALGVMLALALTGTLSPKEAIAGFASDTVLTILSLLILTASLVHTGAVDIAGRALLRAAGNTGTYLLPAIVVSVTVVSAFISNTAAAAFFIPVVIGLASRRKESPSKYLLPLAFASILSSSVTLISTSTNIVVSELLTQRSMAPIGMFELAPVGVPIAVVGVVYMLTIGRWLLPDRSADKPAPVVGERIYQADVVLTVESPLIGKTIGQTLSGAGSGLKVVSLKRGGRSLKAIKKSLKLKEGDDIVLEGERADIIKVKEMPGIDLRADAHLVGDVPPEEKKELAIVEGVLMPQSPLIGRTLRDTEFHDRYGLQVLAVNRADRRSPRKISTRRLGLGDVLLLQGKPEDVKALEKGNLFSIFGSVNPGFLNRKYAPLAAAIFVGVLAAVTLKLAPLVVAALTGAFLVMVTRCISPEEAYRQVEWKVLVLIASLLSLGLAMEQSGTGKYLASLFIEVVGSHNPIVLLGIFFILTVALTQPMSNQAAAVVILPIAIQTATQLDLNPRTFGMMVAVAASCSYLTPLEPACLMVYAAGKYRFADFFRVGAPLSLIIFACALLLVPLVWPLQE